MNRPWVTFSGSLDPTCRRRVVAVSALVNAPLLSTPLYTHIVPSLPRGPPALLTHGILTRNSTVKS